MVETGKYQRNEQREGMIFLNASGLLSFSIQIKDKNICILRRDWKYRIFYKAYLKLV